MRPVALFDKLSSSGKRLGLSFRDVLDITELVNKTISISGASTEAASRAIFQLGQALSIGTLYAEEFNSILENLPRLANVIADGIGKTVGEIKRAGPEAKVTAEQVIKAIKDQADEINRDFSNTQANIGSSFQRLQNSTLRFVGELDKASGITSLFAEAITSLSNSLDTMREKGFILTGQPNLAHNKTIDKDRLKQPSHGYTSLTGYLLTRIAFIPNISNILLFRNRLPLKPT